MCIIGVTETRFSVPGLSYRSPKDNVRGFRQRQSVADWNRLLNEATKAVRITDEINSATPTAVSPEINEWKQKEDYKNKTKRTVRLCLVNLMRYLDQCTEIKNTLPTIWLGIHR